MFPWGSRSVHLPIQFSLRHTGHRVYYQKRCLEVTGKYSASDITPPDNWLRTLWTPRLNFILISSLLGPLCRLELLKLFKFFFSGVLSTHLLSLNHVRNSSVYLFFIFYFFLCVPIMSSLITIALVLMKTCLLYFFLDTKFHTCLLKQNFTLIHWYKSSHLFIDTNFVHQYIISHLFANTKFHTCSLIQNFTLVLWYKFHTCSLVQNFTLVLWYKFHTCSLIQNFILVCQYKVSHTLVCTKFHQVWLLKFNFPLNLSSEAQVDSQQNLLQTVWFHVSLRFNCNSFTLFSHWAGNVGTQLGRNLQRIA